MLKPEPEKIVTILEIFTVRQPVEEIEIKLDNGTKQKQWRYEHFYFTTADKPVTYGGV